MLPFPSFTEKSFSHTRGINSHYTEQQRSSKKKKWKKKRKELFVCLTTLASTARSALLWNNFTQSESHVKTNIYELSCAIFN